MTLWYFETVSMTGRWSPSTAPEKPDTAYYVGTLRIRATTGQLGPRIRRIVEVPEALIDLPLNDLRHALWGADEDIAVLPPLGEVA